MKEPNVATRILAHIKTHGTQSRKMLEDALGMEESTIRRSLRKLLDQEPKPVHRERWDVCWLNSRKYVIPFYALGDAPCALPPATDGLPKRRHKKAREIMVNESWLQANATCEALTEATAGWHHNPSAPPWNAHPTQIAYNPDRDLVHLHTNGTPNHCEAALSLG